MKAYAFDDKASSYMVLACKNNYSLSGCLFFAATQSTVCNGLYYIQAEGILIEIAKTGAPTYHTDKSKKFAFEIKGRYNGLRILSSVHEFAYAYYSATNPIA